MDLSEIEGEWNGALLENNGIVMTTVSTIMTNNLFGMNRMLIFCQAGLNLLTAYGESAMTVGFESLLHLRLSRGFFLAGGDSDFLSSSSLAAR